jgi:hypothetical protein
MYARLLQRFSGSAPSQSSEPPAQVVTTPESQAESSEMPLGLSVLHHPHIEAKTQDIVSIIFVHGLGGSATGTWIHSVSKTFWPTLLHEDDRLMNARISTFGYDANFNNILAAKNALGIADFASQLLDALDLHYDEYGNVSFIDHARLRPDSNHLCCA